MGKVKELTSSARRKLREKELYRGALQVPNSEKTVENHGLNWERIKLQKMNTCNCKQQSYMRQTLPRIERLRVLRAAQKLSEFEAVKRRLTSRLATRQAAGRRFTAKRPFPNGISIAGNRGKGISNHPRINTRHNISRRKPTT